MADFCSLKRGRCRVFEELSRLLEEREDFLVLEWAAANNLQRVFRGKLARDKLNFLARAAITISKTYRGYRGRKKAAKTRDIQLEQESLVLFEYGAVCIQRSFRGFHSRKHNYDHNRHKAYLREVVVVGEAMRAELDEYEEMLRTREKEQADMSRKEELREVTSKLHHLVGTKNCPGIYGSPYFSEVPTIQGIPVEEHLVNSSKDLLRTRGYTKSKVLEKDLDGNLRIPLPRAPNRRTVSSSSPYDAVKKAEQVEKSLHRLKMVGPETFSAGGKVLQSPYRRGVSEGSPYLEAYKNPYLVRGIPQSQNELKLPLSQTTLGKYPRKPFHRSVGGGKSAVLPNGLFDVILEAEVSGGVNDRHRGRNRRFGVPDTCDTLYSPFSGAEDRATQDAEGTSSVHARAPRATVNSASP